jgi:hypothetical protein
MLNLLLGQAARLQRLHFLAGSIVAAPRVAAACRKVLRTKPRKYRI